MACRPTPPGNREDEHEPVSFPPPRLQQHGRARQRRFGHGRAAAGPSSTHQQSRAVGEHEPGGALHRARSQPSDGGAPSNQIFQADHQQSEDPLLGLVEPAIHTSSVTRSGRRCGAALYDDHVQLRPYLFVGHDRILAERHPGADEDVHFSRGLVAAVLEDLTSVGSRVLDPFAGFGTTLQVAEEMGRRAVGVELLPERCAVAAAAAPTASVVQGDARNLAELVEGPFDLVLTSPPYMAADDGDDDPLSGYTGASSYRNYLRELRSILASCLNLLAPNGHLVVNVANIHSGAHFTPLAWDVGRLLAEVGSLSQDVFVCWDRPWHDLAGDYVLVARPTTDGQARPG